MENFGYSKKVIDHFNNPRNCGILSNADGEGTSTSSGCGDRVWIYIAIKNEHIADISFQAHGCPCAIACASILTEMALGKHVDDAADILDEHVAKKLDLSEEKAHCSSIAASALHEAIYNYIFRPSKKEERKVLS